jgi:signal transduction histidine kinase
VKFTPEGGHVSVSCDAGTQAGTVVVHVTHTGLGLAAAHHEKVFEPFVQVSGAVSADDGVGLGLSISRDLARAMGGDIVVRSELGVGSTFTVTLPAAR